MTRLATVVAGQVAAAAVIAARAAAITARTLVPLPPSPRPDMLYTAIDGTGVPMTSAETEDRPGKTDRPDRHGGTLLDDGRARTREVKLAALFTQTTLDGDGRPVRDPGWSSYLASFAPAAEFAQTPAATSALVSVASPTNQHPQNAQNEPSLAVDASRPNVLAEGANDLVDMQPCSRLASTTAGACSFPLGTFNLGVGLSSVSFSFDRGRTWVHPTYHGLTAADCSPTVEPCTPHPGPIHTVPNFFENGLRSRSDTGVSFGPAPVNGHFSWANGSRLYFSSLATNLPPT